MGSGNMWVLNVFLPFTVGGMDGEGGGPARILFGGTNPFPLYAMVICI